MKEILDKLLGAHVLSFEEAKELLFKITSGQANDVQIVAAITAMMMRNVSAQELNGFRQVLLDECVKIKLDATNAIDVCGTGGDAKDTFNISTLAAVVIAAAGYKVIKHGNYGVSSLCGSSTILEHFGYKFTADEFLLNEQLAEVGICFLHAPIFHPCLKKVSVIRKELGVRTFFNFLGPLVNPVQPAYQLTGVYNLNIARMYNEILNKDRKGYAIVHSADGYDEVSLTGKFKLYSKQGEAVVYPEQIGQKMVLEQDLFGGKSVKDSAVLFKDVLSGLGTSIQQRVVLVNAAYGIQCFKPEQSFIDCYGEAEEALVSGKALNTFRKLIEVSNRKKIQLI